MGGRLAEKTIPANLRSFVRPQRKFIDGVKVLQAMNNREPGREETLGVINSMLLFYTIENAIHNELVVSKSFEGERYYTVA